MSKELKVAVASKGLMLKTAFCAVSLAVMGTLAFAEDLRVSTTINSKSVTAAQIEDAFFPKEIRSQKEECAKLEKAGFRCQSVLPKSSLDTGLVTFDRGSDKLTEEAKTFLRQVGSVLSKNKDSVKELLIEGHADATGSADLNQRLSERRAAAVSNFLVQEFGLSKVSAVGHGNTQLKDPSNPTSGENRRVEFVLDW